MSLEKVLHKIQSQIDSLAPVLELFVDETIQPSVDNCEKLQQQLTLIQEYLAVYKHYKATKEISPSFSIHAKVSEKEIPEVKTKDIATNLKENNKIKDENQPFESLETNMKENSELQTSFQPVAIGINDKFRFINELFDQNTSEYNIAIEQLNVARNWGEAEIYLASLQTLYNWKENSEVVSHFFSIAKKRFN